jgi:hypothetical protein
MSDVVRPGLQIDRVVNPNQFEQGHLFGPARPLPESNSTDFFAHGLNLGVMVHY